MNKSEFKINYLAFGHFLLAVGGLILGAVVFYGAYNEYLQDKVLSDMLEEGYVLTVDATATSEDIMAGKNGYVNGSLVAGSLINFDTSDATADEYKIIKGKTAYSDGMLIIGAIELYSNSKPIVPTITAQQIDGGVYLMQDLVISGDVNLIPENIRKGVEIFGVYGTFDGSQEEENE